MANVRKVSDPHNDTGALVRLLLQEKVVFTLLTGLIRANALEAAAAGAAGTILVKNRAKILAAFKKIGSRFTGAVQHPKETAEAVTKTLSDQLKEETADGSDKAKGILAFLAALPLFLEETLRGAAKDQSDEEVTAKPSEEHAVIKRQNEMKLEILEERHKHDLKAAKRPPTTAVPLSGLTFWDCLMPWRRRKSSTDQPVAITPSRSMTQ